MKKLNIKPIGIIPVKPVKFKSLIMYSPKKQRIPKKPNKNLTFKQAQQKYFINPFGDWDKDKVPNWKDCRPFDRFRHVYVPSHLAKKKVQSYYKPGGTFETHMKEAEARIPDYFGRGARDEEEYSHKMAEALQKRATGPATTPFRRLVGVHTLNVPMDVGQTQMVHEYLRRYLVYRFPKRTFKFNLDQPSMVMEIYKDDEGKTVKSVKKLSKALGGDAPQEIRDLLSQLVPRHRKVRVLITDSPTDVIMQSTWPKNPKTNERPWTSCHTLGGGCYEQGPFHDVALKNAIAYFYFGDKVPGIDTPSGRIALKWGETMDGRVGVGLERDVYPFSKESETVGEGTALRQALQDYIQKKGFFTETVRTPYSYRGYSDTASGPGKIVYRPYSRQAIGVTEDIQAFKKKFAMKEKLPKAFVPHLALEAEPEIKRLMIGRKDLPEKYIRLYSEDYSPQVRRMVAQREELPKEIRKRLSEDTSRDVKLTLLETKDLDARELNKIITRPEGGLDTQLVKMVLEDYDDETPVSVMNKIARYGDEDAKIYLAETRNLPASIISLLLKSTPRVKARLIETNLHNLPQGIIKQVIKEADAHTKQRLISHATDLPLDVKNLLSRDSSIVVLRTLAAVGFDLPEQAQLNIIRTGESELIRIIANRRDLPPVVALEISTIPDDSILHSLIHNSTLFRNLYNRNKKLRIRILRNIVENYQYEKNIIQKVTQKHGLPLDLIQATIDKTGDWVISYFAGNTKLSPAVYRYLINEAERMTSRDALSRLAENPGASATVRREAISAREELFGKPAPPPGQPGYKGYKRIKVGSRAHQLLRILARHNEMRWSDIFESMGYPRRHLPAGLGQFMDKVISTGAVEKIRRGVYRITSHGRYILDEIERFDIWELE
jgi:uncharacterized protein (DUF2336 family)